MAGFVSGRTCRVVVGMGLRRRCRPPRRSPTTAGHDYGHDRVPRRPAMGMDGADPRTVRGAPRTVRRCARRLLAHVRPGTVCLVRRGADRLHPVVLGFTLRIQSAHRRLKSLCNHFQCRPQPRPWNLGRLRPSYRCRCSARRVRARTAETGFCADSMLLDSILSAHRGIFAVGESFWAPSFRIRPASFGTQ